MQNKDEFVKVGIYISHKWLEIKIHLGKKESP